MTTKNEDTEGKFYKGQGTIIRYKGQNVILIAEDKDTLEEVFNRVDTTNNNCILDSEKISEVVVRKALAGE